MTEEINYNDWLADLNRFELDQKSRSNWTSERDKIILEMRGRGMSYRTMAEFALKWGWPTNSASRIRDRHCWLVKNGGGA